MHDRARPEVVAVGINAVREICLRCPLVMTPELLQDLAQYKRARDKPVATAARALIALFRELAPGMLEKKDRGKGTRRSMDSGMFFFFLVTEGFVSSSPRPGSSARLLDRPALVSDEKIPGGEHS